MSTYLGSAIKRRLYPTVFCYHGCVSLRADVLVFREAIDDIKAHVNMLREGGYTFLTPSDYKAWQDDSVTYDGPVTCLHFDDGLESINLIVPWLIERGIPCGLALITRRLGKIDSDNDYTTWAQIKTWVSTGLVEVLNHTHNLHHLTLVRTDGVLDVAPVMEGPCWIDDGDVVYRETGDTRWYWDFSLIDEYALSVPLWGTDQYDGTSPITTTLTITPKETGTVTVLRFWMALSRPYSSGYDAEVEIRADAVLVWSGTIEPKDYSTRSQWVEREFYSIELDTSFGVVTGVPFDLEFVTANAGSSVGVVFAIPTSDDTDFYAVSNCQGLSLQGSQAAPDRLWQYIDYKAGERYPVKPCIILGFGTGADATTGDYTTYIDDDVQAYTDAVDNWLMATWVATVAYTIPVKGGASEIVGWANPTREDAVIPLNSSVTIDVESLRIEIGSTENFTGGDAEAGNPAEDIAEALTRSYTACFRVYIGDAAIGPWTQIGTTQIYRLQADRAVDVTTFTLTNGVTRYLKIETINGGWLSGTEQNCRWPIWSVTLLSRAAGAAAADPVTQFVYPFGAYLDTGSAAVQQVPGFTDIGDDLKGVLTAAGYTHGYSIEGYRNVTQSEFREPDLRRTEWALGRWIVYGDQDVSVSKNNLAALSGMMFADTVHGGVKWQVATEPDVLGNATIRLRHPVLDFVAFDTFNVNGAGGIAKGILADGGTYLKYTPLAGTFTPTETLTEAGSGATATLTWVEPVMGVMRVSAVVGTWTGGATFTGGGSGATGTGDVPGPVEYADDKTWLQSRGMRALLIISNLYGVDEPSAAHASHCVNNAGTYIPLIVAAAVDNGWDGITMNLEAIPSADRAAATAFYEDLARAMHVAGKLLHATVPAATGTVYDADFWTGWCDHYALVKVCDAIKIMSYTETGPGTDPGPAAPDDFWSLVYAYTRSVIPEFYRRRILCGARMFGHSWNADWSVAEYITYHEAIAYALEYGRRIDTEATELGFGLTTGERVWCGTPLTVARAQEESADLGGVGLWKADDGDIIECFPATRQIGRG